MGTMFRFVKHKPIFEDDGNEVGMGTVFGFVLHKLVLEDNGMGDHFEAMGVEQVCQAQPIFVLDTVEATGLWFGF
jgi:hypothetical protein